MKALIVRLSSFGDQIHVCPAVSDLKKQKPEIEIHWLVQPEFSSVPRVHACVSRVYTVDLSAIKKRPFKGSYWFEFFRLIQTLRKERYDVVLDMQGVIKSSLMAFFSGAKVRRGFGRHGLAERLAIWFYHYHFEYRSGMTSVTKLRSFVRWAFDLEQVEGDPDFGLIKKSRSGAISIAGVLFVPFASHDSKMLPPESWPALARAIHKRYSGLKITLSWGSEAERNSAQSIALKIGEHAMPNVNRLDFMDLIESLSAYQLVVGVDTGITHLANALGIPTVMIFKKSSPELFYTAGSRYSLRLGSANIGPDQQELEDAVLRLIEKTLGGGGT